MDAMKISVVHQNDGSDVRIGKICRSLMRENDVDYLGWQKVSVANKASLGGAKVRLFSYRTGSTRGTPAGLLLFFFWLIFQLFKTKPQVVYCVNEELTFLLGAFKRVLGFRLVCDIFDPFADRNSKSRMHRLYLWIQKLGRRAADALVVTDEYRFDRIEAEFQRKAVVVGNYPECEVATPRLESFQRKDGYFYIAFVGTLRESRGVSHLRAALKELPWLRIRCAGWLVDKEAREFIEDDRVHYFGVVSAEVSRGIMAASDLVLCIYDPSIVNNVHASPNKIYDAMSVGKKCLINDEVLISRFVSDSGLGFLYSYLSPGSLSEVVSKCRNMGREAFEVDNALIALAMSRYSWESAEDELFRALGL